MNNSGKIVNLVNPTNAQDAATKTYVDTSIPVGGIIMWSGTIASIPSNWRLCNGGNGTPDLRNRFVIGASIDDATIGTGGSGGVTKAHTSIETPTNYVTGGSKDAVVVSHSHGVTDPGHQHNFAYKGGDGALWSISGPPDPWSGAGGETRERLTTTKTTGITITSEGQSGTNKNLPPYFALAFIMRVS